MATTCFTPIFGKRIRVTALDECGNLPDAGTEDSMVVTDGFVSVKLSSEVEDANEILTKKADGSICVNERTNPSFKYFTAEIALCGVDPGLMSLLSNAEVYEVDTDTPGGIVVPEGTISKRFAFELWTGLTGACEDGASTSSGYLLLPFVGAGILGDIEVGGEDAVNFTITSAQTRGGNQWGTGPYDVINSGDPETVGPLPTALDSSDHLLLVTTSVAYPDSVCGLQAFPTAA